MTKSTITRERIEQYANDPRMCNINDEIRELARMALAAMDSEPVYQVFEPSDGRWVDVDDEEEMIRLRSIGGETRTLYTAPPSEVVDSEPVAWLLSGGGAKNVVCFDSGNAYADPLREVTPLYRHAQPAPVVPDERDKTVNADDHPLLWSFNEGWNACRAAMLQDQSGDDGEPTDDERIMAIEGIHNCERCGDEGWIVGEMGITRCACNQGNPVFKIDLNSDFIKHVKAVSEKVRAGNSPVIGIDLASGPDRTVEVHYVAPPGYVMVPKEPTDEMIAAAMNCEDVLFNSDDSFCVQFGNIYEAMLAAAPQSPGSEPATVPGKWIPVSEKMPPSRHEVLVGRWWEEKPRWCCKWATYIPGHPDAQSSGWLIPGASWTPTHWMPLPAAPQEVKSES